MATFSTRAIGSSRGFINTEYVCIGTPEETLLETYFMMISKFNFDRAKEQCEKEKEAKAGFGGTNWCDFMNLLSRLAIAEMNYHNLAFVGKSFLKREPLRVTYIVLIQEFGKVQNIYSHGRGGTDFGWEKKLADLITSISEYIMGRMELITMYQCMVTPPEGAVSDTLFTDKHCKAIQQKFQDRFTHSYLKPVNQSFWSEVEVLSHLTLAHHHLSLWQFLPSLISIQTTHNKLLSWCGVLTPGVPAPEATPRLSSIRSRPLSGHIPDSSFPIIYKWLCTFHNSLLSKFTLYFHNILNESGVTSVIKGPISSKFDPDYIYRFQQLVKNSPTSCVCLVFDSTGIKDFQGPEYRVPGTPPISLTGLNSYPIMISIPMDYDFLSHKANIVSMIMSKGALSPSAGISTHHDNKLSTTYHLAQIDSHVTLVAILHTTSREKDSPVITMMTDIIYNLRCHHVLHYLTKK